MKRPGTSDRGSAGAQGPPTHHDDEDRIARKPVGAKQMPAGLDENEHRKGQQAARQAEALREAAFPAYMASALGLSNQFGPEGYQLYLNQVIEGTGNPKDPIERMLVEQLAILHHRIGQLHVDAAHTKGVEASKIYNAATARLLGEFRRTALALRVYRTPVTHGQKVRLAKIG